MTNPTVARLVAALAALSTLAACGGSDETQPAPDASESAAAPAAQGAPTLAGDRIPTENGDLVVHPVHHGTLVMSWNGATLYVDPAPAPGSQGSAAPAFRGIPEPDVVLITDVHGDHLSPESLGDLVRPATTLIAPSAVVAQLPDSLAAIARPLANGETTSVGEIQIEAVPMYNLTEDRLQYHEKGRGNGYVLSMGGVRVYIAGDTEDIPEMRQLEDVDVAFVPMILPYTMTPEQAADAVREFRPRIVYPYHYGDSDVQSFAQMVGDTLGVEVRLRNWYP